MPRKAERPESDPPLAVECASLRRWLPTLDPEMCGRYALVHERALVGVYESEAEAVEKGFETFGAVPFLVRRIPPTERPGRATLGRPLREAP